MHRPDPHAVAQILFDRSFLHEEPVQQRPRKIVRPNALSQKEGLSRQHRSAEHKLVRSPDQSYESENDNDRVEEHIRSILNA